MGSCYSYMSICWSTFERKNLFYPLYTIFSKVYSLVRRKHQKLKEKVTFKAINKILKRKQEDHIFKIWKFPKNEFFPIQFFHIIWCFSYPNIKQFQCLPLTGAGYCHQRETPMAIFPASPSHVLKKKISPWKHCN